MNGTKQDHFTTVLSVQKKGTTFEELMKVYEKWSSLNTYDQVRCDIVVIRPTIEAFCSSVYSFA